MERRRRIIINFKNTADDIKLYEEILSHSSQSGYVKDCLRELKKLKDRKVEVKDNNLEGIEDILGGF